MTEADWLKGADLKQMLKFLRGKTSDRKLQLFNCACCRRIWNFLPDSRSRSVVELAEQLADGLKTEAGFVRMDARVAYRIHPGGSLEWHAAAAAVACGGEEFPGEELEAIALRVAQKVQFVYYLSAFAAEPGTDEVGRRERAHVAGCAAENAEADLQTAMLRHIAGNPFRPYHVPDYWPFTLVQLADAVYAYQGCTFPLMDALEEMGHSELAQHFRDEPWHPKGCWALDLLLNKQ